MEFFNYSSQNRDASGTELTVFNNLSDTDWETLVSVAQTIHFSAGDMLFNEGDEDTGVFILVSGRVEVIGKGSFGIRRSIAEINEGSVFGELSFFDKNPRGAAIRVVTEGHALNISQIGFDKLSVQNPALAMQFLFDLGRILTYRFRKTSTSFP